MSAEEMTGRAQRYGLAEEQYHAWRADCICEGCGAVPDQEHLGECSVRWGQARGLEKIR